MHYLDFHYSWEQRKVTEIGKIYIGLVTTMTKHYTDEGTLLIRNSDIKDGKFEFGDNPIYLEKTFAEKNETRMHQIGDVITVHTGDVGTSAVITENEAKSIGFATIVTRPNPKIIDSNYLCSFLNTDKHKKWAVSISTGDGRTNYNLGDYFELVVPVPSIAEQKKIASYIQKLNRLITLHQRKCQIDGCRFQSPLAITWEQRKLGDIVERIVRKNTNNESSLPLTISAQYGLVDQVTYFNNRVASRDVSNYYLVLNGEFAYNKSTSDGFPFGAVKRLDLYEKGVLSTLYIVFSIRNQNETDSDFLAVFFDTNRWHKGVAERAAEGARNHGLLNISADDFFDIDIFMPRQKEEQVAIGSYLRHLDHLITLHRRAYYNKKGGLTNVHNDNQQHYAIL